MNNKIKIASEPPEAIFILKHKSLPYPVGLKSRAGKALKKEYIMEMESVLHQHKTFEHIIYSGKVIAKREFEQCTFKSCDFSNSNFSNNLFSDCTFVGCNLALMKLNDSKLDNVRFVDCKLIGMNFQDCADFLFSVSFEGCLLDFASFINKKMSKTLFKSSSLKNADFSSTQLNLALFDETDLQSAVFNRTNLQGANFVTAYNYTIDPELNNIRKAKFSFQGIPGLLAKYDIKIE